MAAWTPKDGYFGNLLAALLGQAGRRVEGRQNSGGQGGIGAGQVVTSDVALKLTTFWACCKLVAETIGAMPIKFYDIAEDGTRTPNKSHWLYYVLNHLPNQYQTRNEFIETCVLSYMMHGNLYVAINRRATDNQILSLLPMMPMQTEVSWSRGTERIYKFYDGTNVSVLAQQNVWHAMLMPTNGVIGLSPLQYGARTLGIASSADSRVGKLAENGFKPTGVLMIDRALGKDQRDAIRQEFSDLQTGQGDPLRVLEAGMKYQAVTMSPRDLQLLESRRFNTEEICRLMGVPSVLVNDTQAGTTWGSGIAQIKEGFYALNLRPMLEKFEASMKRWLLPRTERERVDIEFDFGALLRGNAAERTDTATKAIAGNVKTINEVRAEEGLAPIPNGDVMYAQSQMVPLGTMSDDNPDA